MTKKVMQLAFLSLEPSKKGFKVGFITAESCERAKGQFSKEIFVTPAQLSNPFFNPSQRADSNQRGRYSKDP